MPSLSFFIDEHDVSLLVDRLNADPEIAFIVPDDPLGLEDEKANRPPRFSPAVYVHRDRGGELKLEMGRPRRQRWKAVRTVDALKDGEHSLWHVPAGPLPLVEMDPGPRPLIGPEGPGYPPIPDPWAGWIGPPGFGSGCHPWIRLELWTRHRPYTQQERNTLHELNYFWRNQHDMLVVSGFQWTGSHFRKAPPQTQRWWNRVKGWVDRTAVRLRSDPGFWAFPSALQKLKDGMRYYSRNYDLDDAIREAGVP
jgi:hypothetical protein